MGGRLPLLLQGWERYGALWSSEMDSEVSTVNTRLHIECQIDVLKIFCSNIGITNCRW